MIFGRIRKSFRLYNIVYDDNQIAELLPTRICGKPFIWSSIYTSSGPSGLDWRVHKWHIVRILIDNPSNIQRMWCGIGIAQVARWNVWQCIWPRIYEYLVILQTFIINKQSRDLLTLAKNLINKLEINQIIIIIIINCVLNRD